MSSWRNVAYCEKIVQIVQRKALVFTVIDSEGYRPNVGIILCNADRRLFWAKRIGQHSWQFPQGGIRPDESPEQAMFRELAEEVGLQKEHVKVIGCTSGWLRYRLPKRLIRPGNQPACIGQKQVWFLLQMISGEDTVRLDSSEHPEFDHWQWVDYWYPLRAVVPFKRHVYWHALRELAPLLFPCRASQRLPAMRKKGSPLPNRPMRRDMELDRSSAPSRAQEAPLDARHPPEPVRSTTKHNPMIILPLRRMDIHQHPVITRMVISTRHSGAADSLAVVAAPARESSKMASVLDDPCLPGPPTSRPHRFLQR